MKKNIGIIGGGQLGKMLSLAAQKLGFEVSILDPSPNCPAAQVSQRHTLADFKDQQAIEEFGQGVDYLTYEIESANTNALENIYNDGKKNSKIKTFPYPHSLSLIKNKFSQKTLLDSQKLPLGPFQKINKLDEAIEFGDKHGYPYLLKAELGAYDGRGNAVVKSPNHIIEALAKLGQNKESKIENVYAEAFINFKRELAIVATRNKSAEIAYFPVVETEQQDNICHLVKAAADIKQEQKSLIESISRQVGDLLDFVGSFAIEFFEMEDGRILINELAPRVHNSGHYSIEACASSQFEQHIRAITGMELASTELLKPACMINLIAKHNAPVADTAPAEGLMEAVPESFLHFYGKAEYRIARKMGHITALGDDLATAVKRAELAASMFEF